MLPRLPRGEPDLQNHTWIKTYPLTPGVSVSDVIDRPYQSTWYVLKDLRPGDDVKVVLAQCAVDYTLLGYVDVRDKAKTLLALVPALSSLPVQQQQLGGDTAADDMDSDDMDSDDMDSDDMDSDDMDSDDMDSDDMDSDDMDSDDMDSDDMDSDDMDSDGVPDVDQFKDVYGAAQRRALRAASITPGVADEAIFMTVRDGGGDLYFRVRGHHGAFAPEEPFTITATVTRSNVCEGAQLEPRASRPRDVGDKTTLILTNTSRPSLKLTGPNEKKQFLAQLRKLEGPTSGFVYDLADNDEVMEIYAAWDRSPRCVPQANAVVHSIRRLIEMFESKRPVENVVLAGADDVIPFLRIADRAEISRESGWTGPYAARTPLDESLAQGFFLSDDAYGTVRPIDRLGRQIYLPTRAVGRLVETADDITKHVAWFVREGKKGVSLSGAIVTGYTFVGDLGHAIADVLAKASTTVDKTLVRDDWSADDLRRALFGGTAPGRGSHHHDLIAAQGHYSANTLVPADNGPRFHSAELKGVTTGDFAGTIWATIGCHSGHDIVDTQATPYANPTSFAETLLALGATVVAGTGYQYAESVLLKNSEQLYVHFAEELTLTEDIGGKAYGNGVPIGRALINAKQRYRKGLLTPRGMDEKIVGVVTLYGLPHLRVRVPRPQPRPKGDRGARVPVEATRTEGLTTAQLSIDRYSLEAATAKTGESYYAVDGQTIATPLRPILPAIFRDVTVEGSVAIGAVWVEGEYADRSHEPLIARPVTERDPRMPHYRNRALLPARPLRLDHFESGRQSLVFAPMQFRYDERGGTARLWSSARFKIYYSSRTDVGTLRDAPLIRRPRFENVGGNTRVSVSVTHWASLEEEVEAFATYDDGAGRLR